MNWDAWLLGARTGRALVLLVGLAVGWAVWEANRQGPPVQEETTTAVVTAVQEHSYNLALDDGRQARVPRQGDYRAGDRLTVVRATYANGEEAITLPPE